MKRIGFLINPISGLGGSVGLKGTDGAETVRKALDQGAKPKAAERALTTLKSLQPVKNQFTLLTPNGLMGESVALEAGLSPIVLRDVCKNAVGLLTDTTFQDTVAAARIMKDNADLIIFTGGDGTARNVMDAIGTSVVCIGVPAGVKMHSGVFATTPQSAGLLVREFVEGRIRQFEECEVMDIDENAFRDGRVSASLYGYMTIPFSRGRTQGGKVSNPQDLQATEGIGRSVSEEMQPDCLYIVGPGSTTAAVMKALCLPNTLLGVDLVKDRRLVASDVGEKEILVQLKKSNKAKIIVTPIGGQACLFGRGNQQISPDVLYKTGKENIIIVATKAKIQTFYGGNLLVDAGNEEANKWLKGYYRVIVAYRQETVMSVDNI
ncbi:MAG: ATP-NAD kinase family protein [Oscillospiraceae bacterium]|nr:ATP-NAD kinase family protein [Oscillospiraceae bacterium]